MIPLLPLLLLLRAVSVLSARSPSLCPSGCDCLPDPLQQSSLLVSCHWTSFPASFIFSNVSSIRSLHIICDAPFSLPETAFRGLSALQQLRIENCRTRELPPKIFEELTDLRQLELTKLNPVDGSLTLSDECLSPLVRLEQLQLTHCKLPYLPQRLFCSLAHLQVVNVSSNALLSLATDKQCSAGQLIIADFSRNNIASLGTDLSSLPVLRHLSLSHNALSGIHKGELDGNRFIQQLELEDNILTSADALPETIVTLNLAFNHLSTIPLSIIGLPHLANLNLSNNLLGDINSTTTLNSTSIERVDLSHNKLTTVPTVFFEKSLQNLTTLRLEGNQIARLEQNTFLNYSRLHTLNLGSNRIEVVKYGALAGLQQLNMLALHNNSLHTIEPAALEGLTIDNLDLSHNSFTEAPMALGQLFKLKKINLSYNRISKLYQFVFKQIPHLHKIDLSHNELQSIGPHIFSDCDQLTQLDLSSNRISLLFKDAFSKCPLLTRLNLSSNRISFYEDSLSQASAVRRLDLSDNRIEILQWTALPASLEQLSLDRNLLTILGAAPSVEQSSIRSVSLRNNQLTQLSPEQIPGSIEVLDVAHNKIQHIAKKTFAEKSSLRQLNLTANSLKSLSLEAIQVTEGVHPVEVHLRMNPLMCSCEMNWIRDKDLTRKKVILMEEEQTNCKKALDESEVPIGSVDETDFLCDYTQVCEPECICCQYANCDCKSTCPPGCRCLRDAAFKTNIVQCQGNDTHLIKSLALTDLPQSATHIFLSHVSLPVLKTNSFVNRRRLQQLRLNATGLTAVQPRAFHLLPSLRLLDLSDNRLTHLSGDEFHKTPLTHLFLNGNELQTVETSLLARLPSLKFLTLHDNGLVFPPEHLAALDSVSLAGNPFRCDCSARGPPPQFSPRTAPFWVQNNRARIIDLARVLCVENVTRAFRENDTTVLSAYPPNVGNDIFTMPIEEFLRDFNVSICVPLATGFFGSDPHNSVLFLVFGLSALLLLCTLICLAFALIRKSHEAMNQRRYKTSSLNCSSTPGSSPLPLPLINYHAFVSYSKKDEKMILDEIIRPLEEEDFHLCLLHRDGPIYNSNVHSVSDELIDQINASQCLIIFITKNWIENEWQTLGIKTSHQLFAKNRTKRLIAIVGENVQPNGLDEELGQILRKNTCVRLRDHLFWSLLRSSLPVRLSPPPSDASQIYSDVYGIVPSAIV